MYIHIPICISSAYNTSKLGATCVGWDTGEGVKRKEEKRRRKDRESKEHRKWREHRERRENTGRGEKTEKGRKKGEDKTQFIVQYNTYMPASILDIRVG